MKTPEQANGEALTDAPSMSDIAVDMTSLVHLVEITEEMLGEVTVSGMADKHKAMVFKSQTLLRVAAEFARGLDAQIDRYVVSKRT